VTIDGACVVVVVVLDVGTVEEEDVEEEDDEVGLAPSVSTSWGAVDPVSQLS
jgi:hypothetical protein